MNKYDYLLQSITRFYYNSNLSYNIYIAVYGWIFYKKEQKSDAVSPFNDHTMEKGSSVSLLVLWIVIALFTPVKGTLNLLGEHHKFKNLGI